jgi:hypothetical protein
LLSYIFINFLYGSAIYDVTDLEEGVKNFEAEKFGICELIGFLVASVKFWVLIILDLTFRSYEKKHV